MERAGIYGRLLAVLALSVFLWPGSGQSQVDAAAEIARQTPQMIEKFADLAKGIAEEKPARLEEFQELAAEIARKERTRLKGQAEEMVPSPAPSGERILLFVTLGDNPAENLDENRRLLKEIHEVSPDAVVVVRGLPQGSRTLGDLFKYINQITGKDAPPIMLNPVLFRRYGVSVAPALVYERDGTAVAWARGIINSAWLKRRVEQEKATGDLGKWGQTAAIAERDLIEEMKARLAGMDWQAKKEQAVANYWQKQRFVDLPKTKEEKVFYLDATYKVDQDFILPDGKVIARAGDKIDLFKAVPPTFMLVVFDAADPQQVEWAVHTGQEYAGKYRVKYLATRIPDVEHGWESLERLQEHLQAPVYLLNEPVRDRFKLKHVPSTIRFVKVKHKFQVNEIAELQQAKVNSTGSSQYNNNSPVKSKSGD